MQTLKQRARSLVFSLKRSATLANGPFSPSKGTGGGRSRVEEAERRGSELEREGKRWRNVYIYILVCVYAHACRKGAKSIVDKCVGKDCSRTIVRQGMMILRIDSRGGVVNVALKRRKEKKKDSEICWREGGRERQHASITNGIRNYRQVLFVYSLSDS